MLIPVSHIDSNEARRVVRWGPDPSAPDTITANPPFGILTHAIASSPTGQLLYDLPLWWERPAAICVTIDEQSRLILVYQRRPVVVPPDSPMPYPDVTLEQCGADSLECPRGSAQAEETPRETAIREVEEETRMTVEQIEFLGWNNTNTATFPYSHCIWLVKVNSARITNRDADPNEEIRQVMHYTWGETMAAIISGKIFCGMTKSALMTWFAHQNLKI